jgi:2,5-furandicarboxylate decarboxylase 1
VAAGIPFLRSGLRLACDWLEVLGLELRGDLARLADMGQLRRIRRPVSPVFELAAVAWRANHGPALLFESVGGTGVPVATGVGSTPGRVAALLGVQTRDLIPTLRDRLDHPVAPVEVGRAPVQEVVHVDDADLTRLPVVTHYERDAGPFITAGVVIAEDPVSGERNCSFNRLHVRGPRETGINVLPRHLWRMVQRAEAAGRPLEVAVVLGVDTAVRIAAATWGASMPFSYDELAYAGALRGEAVPLVRCRTVGVRVPADAEIVIEGEIPPHVRAPEGPMMEFTGVYGDVFEFPVVRVRAITHRHDAIYHDMLPFSAEHLLLLGLPYAPMIGRAVAGAIGSVAAVHVTPGGCGKFHAVVAIEKHHPADGRDAILAALSAVRDIKQVIVVDADVDVTDPHDVEWAIATRFQADRDLIVLSGGWGNLLDPSTPTPGLSAKLGIDATIDLAKPERFERGRIPGLEGVRLEDYV